MDQGKSFSLIFGLVTNPIEKQLADQGIQVERPEFFERAKDSITFLYLHGYLTDSAAQSARQKLIKAITKEARPVAVA